ncbi:STAS domain-containing protein [Streptomyces sp. NPDC058662]|uniref:STAS domain-containing protein n=1 Tax=Streptomyces sp. NPDC058662 TaxID=3346583 RepID=UPI0036494963
MTGPAFQVGPAIDADTVRLRLVGALDLEAIARLRVALADCLARRCDRLVLDLRDLRFCDCAGLNVLLEAKAATDRIGADLRVEGADGQVARLFALAGVTELFAESVPRLPPRTA